MLRRKLLRPLLVGVGVVALQALSASSALAYSITITAAGVCADGAPAISYTVRSWDTHPMAQNTQVDVLFGNVVVDSQPLLLPTNSFSGTKPSATTGAVTVTANAVGVWGDGEAGSPRSASTTVTVPANCQEVAGFGRFTGGPNAIEVGGTKVTTGLQIHCHPKDPSVNFEINWGGGENFHLTDVTTVSCFDNPLITAKPPRTPVNTIVATGYGTLNGVGGYTIQFTLIDSGEPDNKRTDQIAILIYPTGNPGSPNLTVTLQNITAGNIQAHYDQPHGGNGNK